MSKNKKHKQINSQEETAKASQATAEKCLNEINIILEKYNCTLEVKHVQDVIMGQPVLKFGSVVMHHVKPLK